VLGIQIGCLILDLFLGHYLCFKYPNGSCKPILDICVPRSSQWYKKPSIMYTIIEIQKNHFQRKYLKFVMNNILITFFLEKIDSNTWFLNGKTFVAGTRINKIYVPYLKPSFDLEIYIIQFFFQYIIILLINFNLCIWMHLIYPHKIFIIGS